MATERKTSRYVAMHEIDPVLVERELVSFRKVLTRPITVKRLDHWFGTSQIRADLFSNTLWGTIRWRKSIGLPLAPTLASAFVIEHSSWQSVKKIENGKVYYVELLVPHPEPSKWDGPGDDDYHRVSFMAETPERKTRVRVNFAAHVGWEHRIQVFGRGYRDIDPLERNFLKDEKRYVLEPFEVISKPYSLLK